MSTLDDFDSRILALFDGARPLPTPTPGAQAWLVADPARGGASMMLRRASPGVGKGRATAALSLMHENVVRTRRWMAEGGALYVVRDIARGPNLLAYAGANAAGFTTEALRRALLPVIDALEAAHAQDVVHGGVSPENILIGDDGAGSVADFATADPSAPQHARLYGGALTPQADIAALGAVVARFLPVTGAFASPAVRSRIEGILQRCDTLGDIRETVNALEKLAAAPAPKAVPQPAPRPLAAPVLAEPGRPAPERPVLRGAGSPPPSRRAGERAPGTFDDGPAGRLAFEQEGPLPRVAPGAGGTAALTLHNDGKGPVIVRMIATQHAWLNVRPLDLPLTIPPGGHARVPFVLSAARLSPGEYRSEVYLSASAPEGGAAAAVQALAGGWYRHTAEIRIRVDSSGATPR